MNKTLVAIFFVLYSGFSFAQNNTETSHLTFKGVPIDGKLSDYILKMQANGFTHVTTKDGVAILKGDFASYKNCIVGVSTLKQKDLVSKVTVMFTGQDAWSSLSSNYYSLKELLTEKYGKPSEVTEEFNGAEPRDDRSRMYEVKFDRCRYYTVFKTEKGIIGLSIEHDGVISCFVQLSYNDKINGEIIKAKALDDL